MTIRCTTKEPTKLHLHICVWLLQPGLCFFFPSKINMLAPIKVKTQLVCVRESALCLLLLNVGWAGVFFIPVFQMRREVPEELRQRHWTSHPAQSCYTEPRRTASKQAPGHDRIRAGAAANVLKSLEVHTWPPTLTAPSSSATSSWWGAAASWADRGRIHRFWLRRKASLLTPTLTPIKEVKIWKDASTPSFLKWSTAICTSLRTFPVTVC